VDGDTWRQRGYIPGELCRGGVRTQFLLGLSCISMDMIRMYLYRGRFVVVIAASPVAPFLNANTAEVFRRSLV
jgi:hypothetical protein